MYSAARLRALTEDIQYLDAQAERLNAETTIARIRRMRPDFVVTVISLPSLHDDGRLLQMLKSEYAECKLITIGTVCRVLPQDVARASLSDAVVTGDPELILPRLIHTLRDGGEIEGIQGVYTIQNEQSTSSEAPTDRVNIRDLPWPPYDMMPIASYHDAHFGSRIRCLPIWASRGCPMPCSYCPYPLGMGNAIRFRPSEDVVKEMVHLNTKYGVTAFHFRDQTFSLKPDRVEEMCDLLAAENLRIRWLCETRLDMVSEKLLRKMKKAGCSMIYFGLETGDPDLLRTTGKPGMKMSTVKETIGLTKDVGIKPLTHLILGLPGESRATVENTLTTLRELGIVNISINFATPYPGTQMFQQAMELGLIETQDWSKYTSFNPVMRSESLSIAELLKLRDFLSENLYGSTLFERVRYLCRNRAIIEALSYKLSDASDLMRLFPKLLHRPSSRRRHDLG
jgi:anaerobic magnesium-protoporphyrin IX monomethyl ester cyclase